MTAHYAIADGVAVVTIDNPPVNGLGIATRTAIVESLARAQADAGVTAVVLTGAGRVFSGGADIREFNTPKAAAAPTLRMVIAAIEASAKPVVAAVHGVAMGGGLELALGCHYRVATPDAQIALPEIRLGLLPGAGGTQRLPRLVGLDVALAMITTGDPVRADAVDGVFARTFTTDLAANAMAFARDAAAGATAHPRVRDRAVPPRDVDAFRRAARESLPKSARGLPAPQACIDALCATLEGDFDDGLKAERAAFERLLASPEARAMRHVFFAERAAARIADVPADTRTRDIRTVAVIGAGTMGTGIAIALLNVGIAVRLHDADAGALDRGLATIRRHFESAVAKGRLSLAEAQRRGGLVAPAATLADVAAADLAIEAVFEDMAVKLSTFGQLDRVLKPGAILASNTSTLDLDALAAATGRPQDVVGLHFFSPAHAMKLLEVVRGARTGADVLATAMKFAGRLGKTPVVSGVCDGFIGNRMIGKYLEQANLLLLEGALPEDVDRAIEAYGFAMGPFRMSDVAGNDIGWAVRKRRYAEGGDNGRFRASDRLCERGRFGQKTQGGWYDYAAGARDAQPSPAVHAMLRELVDAAGTRRAAIGDEEIVDRLLLSLVNEGARILEEGIAARASDIDVVYVTGYGYPRHRGGPMFDADRRGLPAVLTAIERFARGPHGDAWRVAPLLAKLAALGRTFNE
ncbi:MAG: 3-hydroxyacyl-CoA dehydrogenase NAD-binding domain-containing protein [Burkholderiales bacterium]